VLHAPGILFLDEPTSGVDPSERDVFWQVIRFLSKKMGITVLVTTHYMDEAEYCDRVSLMNRGKIISIGSPDDLKRRAITSIGNVYELITKNPFQDYEKLIKIGFNVMTVGRRIRVYSKEKLSKEDFEKMGIIPVSLRESEITMEEVFIDAVKKSEGNSC